MSSIGSLASGSVMISLFPGDTYDKVTSKPTPAERAEEFLRSNIQSEFFLDGVSCGKKPCETMSQYTPDPVTT